MFAILVVEREPIKLESLPANLLIWTLTAGAVAAVGGLIVGLFTRFSQKPPPGGPRPRPSRGGLVWLPVVVVAGVVLGVVPLGLNYLWKVLGWQPSMPLLPDVPSLRTLLYALNVVAAV